MGCFSRSASAARPVGCGALARGDDPEGEDRHEMKPNVARARFLKRLEGAGLALDALTPVEGVEAMLDYYAEERFDGCVLKHHGDALLFQWGVNDWGRVLPSRSTSHASSGTGTMRKPNRSNFP
jgi:hypothetical protein